MSKPIRAIAVAALLIAPALAFAQSTTTVTRAQVRAELVQLEAAGYKPAANDQTGYPSDVQAAETRVLAQPNQLSGISSVGGMPVTGTSASGSRKNTRTATSCNGPTSFCNLYSGS